MRKTKTGDVFLLPIDNEKFGVGQVIARYAGTDLFYLAVFSEVVEGSQNGVRAEDLAFGDIILLVNTFDVKIADGDWPVIGNLEPPDGVPFPSYKVGLPGKAIVESWDGKKRRRAKPGEEELLDFRSGVAPIRLEKALKALHGVLPWQPSFDELTRDYVARRCIS